MTVMRTLPSSRLQASAATIAAYAELTRDYNPLHLDAAFARTTPMGSVIAHGTLSLHLVWQSLIAAFGRAAIEGNELDVRFVKPTRVDEWLSAGGEVDADDPGLVRVWVRGDDGEDRVRGTMRLARTASA